jgi:transcriptional regulator with XRE-family HTH domain
LARRIGDQGGSISAAYLAELRTGRKTNPSLEHIRQIAQAFGVRPGYFLDEEVAERVDRELDRLEERHRTSRLQELAARTASLDDDDRSLLADLVQRELEKRETPRSQGSEQ